MRYDIQYGQEILTIEVPEEWMVGVLAPNRSSPCRMSRRRCGLLSKSRNLYPEGCKIPRRKCAKSILDYNSSVIPEL